ncbi:hypothetical protein EOPP23_15720 [Endozoicomonas sp. OPT23]|uniref:C45 family autoproteolytic acyltransferase/hydolase n=1 Tax=Endozoicomonas sp. OPT23 TaxID=2072845 RepID=UPI00129B2C8F|nr:C45 family peptidase [Endozoicomonas sp. OPT23]MRI34437.1 hypothetical protein [Endozoicomonas sp. OPT23]
MKKLVLKGTALQRGQTHGEQMRNEIHEVLDYYRSRFLSNRDKLQSHVDQLMAKVELLGKDYKEEMDGIASSANVDPFWIYCINARSELMSSPVASSPMECSTVSFPKNGLLGQNWDWAEALEGKLALADITLENGHRFFTMTEPGMLAKIGMNDSGLGVCLNILPARKKLTGLPVHILLRALLECRSVEEAKTLIQIHGAGKASHVLVADSTQTVAVELAPDQPWFQNTQEDWYLHTNHYLQQGQAQPTTTRECTETRLKTLHERLLYKPESSLSNIRQLLDINEKPFPILRPYAWHELTGNGGTLVTMLLDLNKKEMLLREGFDSQNGFDRYSFS